MEGPGFLPGNAVDGDASTRWSSGQWMQAGQVAWYYVDLGSPQPIRAGPAHWETAYGVDYQIQVSDDASNWTTLVGVVGNRGFGHSQTYDGLSEMAGTSGSTAPRRA